MRFLALGDSYTIGESVPESARWPVQLVDLLRREGIGVAELQIIAQTGWTTAELSAGIDAAVPHGVFDLVSLLIGVNNQYRGLSQAEYRTEFKALLQRAIGFAGGEPSRVMVLSIPDWGVTPFAADRDRAAIARDIDAFNKINHLTSERVGAGYVDVTPVSRQAAGDAMMVADDGLHPSGGMYAQWAELALPVARRILTNI
ncbi:MAG: SGNH/GDSL hydrolase family protein [Anaerolineae bacterium]